MELASSSTASNFPINEKESSERTESSDSVNGSTVIKDMTSREADIWMVKTLNSGFVPNLKRSPVIEKLEDKRKEMYKNILKEIEKSFKSVVEYGNSSLRLLAETFQGELEINYNSIDELQYSIKEPFSNVNKDSFIKYFMKLDALQQKRKSLIDEFEEEAKEELNKQLNDIKKIVAENHVKINKIGLLPKPQLQMQFENSVMEIQKVIMSNYRTYAELKLHLQLLGEELASNVRSKIGSQYDLWLSKSWRHSESRITSPDKLLQLITNGHKLAKDSPNDMCTILTRELNQLSYTFAFVKSAAGDTLSAGSQGVIDRYPCNLKNIHVNMDDCVRQTIIKYASAINELRNGYENDLIKLDNRYPQISAADKGEYLKEVGHPEMERIFKIYVEEERELRGRWRLVAEEIRSSLIETLSIFGDSSEVRDRHFMRLEQGKDLLAELLNKVIDTKLDDEKAVEMKINIAVDTLRQASTKEKINKTFDEIIEQLNMLKNNYKKDFVKELEILNEFQRISQIEVEVFIGEIEAFLNKHPRNTIVDIYKIVPPRTDNGALQLDSDDKNATSNEMRMCFLHLTSVSNWTLGLWEGMNTMKNSASRASKADANKWIADQRQILGNNFNWKLQMHQARYTRIKTEIMNVRFVELETHVERLKSHTIAVENKLVELNNDVSDMRSKQGDVVSEMKSKIEDCTSKLDECTVSVFAKNLVTEIENTQKETEILLKQLYDECRDHFEHEVKWLRQSNVLFLSSLKMFSEGGNYSWEEARIMSNEIQRIAKVIDTSEGEIMRLLKIEIPDDFVTFFVDSESLKTVEKKLILHQQLEKEVSLLQYKLRKATSEMKQEGKMLHEEVEKLNNDSEERKITEILPDLLEQISKRQNNLSFPEATKNLEFCFDEKKSIKSETEESVIKKRSTSDTKEKSSSKMEISRKETNKKSAKAVTKQITYKDFRNSLYKYTNPDELLAKENNFLSVTKAAILKSFGVLQELLKEIAEVEFTDGKDPSDLTMRYEKNILQYLQELQNYNLQCEEVWLIQISDFLHEVTLFKFHSIDYITSNIDEIHGEKCKKLYTLLEKYKQDRKLIYQDSEKRRTEIEKKLKPIVGAPANKQFLVSLNDLAGSTNCDIAKSFVTCLNKFKESLKKELEAYENIFQEKESIYEEILNFSFDDNICKDLMKNLLMLRAPRYIESLNEEDEDDSQTSIDEENNKKQDSKYEEMMLYIGHLVSRIQQKMLELGVHREEMEPSLDRSSVVDMMSIGFEMKPFPIQAALKSLKEKYSDKLLTMAEEAVAENDKNLEEAEKWINNWSADVDKVRKLYVHNV